MLREARWTDRDGRQWRTLIPTDAPESEAELGVPDGPPSLAALQLPIEIEVRLHNELYARRIFYYRDARRRPAEVMAALQAALKLDAHHIIDLYGREAIDGPSAERVQ